MQKPDFLFHLITIIVLNLLKLPFGTFFCLLLSLRIRFRTRLRTRLRKTEEMPLKKKRKRKLVSPQLQFLEKFFQSMFKKNFVLYFFFLKKFNFFKFQNSYSCMQQDLNLWRPYGKQIMSLLLSTSQPYMLFSELENVSSSDSLLSFFS